MGHGGSLPWREEEKQWVARMDLVAAAEPMLADLPAAAECGAHVLHLFETTRCGNMKMPAFYLICI
jgi:hypothetical protein